VVQRIARKKRRYCRGRQLNVGWKLRRQSKRRPTESWAISWMQKKVKEVIKNTSFVDPFLTSSRWCYTEGVKKTLEDDLGTELAALATKDKDSTPLLFTPNTKRSNVDNAPIFFLLLWNVLKQLKRSPRSYSSIG